MSMVCLKCDLSTDPADFPMCCCDPAHQQWHARATYVPDDDDEPPIPQRNKVLFLKNFS
jgi:hypothetical protein